MTLVCWLVVGIVELLIGAGLLLCARHSVPRAALNPRCGSAQSW